MRSTSLSRASVAELDRIFGSLGEEGEELERDRRELETRAAGLKAIATWHATQTVQTCREACGGAGYLAENRLPELKADTDVFTTFEGDNTILLQLVAKSLLTGYRDQFGELNPLETAGFFAAVALQTVVERSAAGELVRRLTDDLVPSRERDEDLADRDYHRNLFRWREEHVLSGVARRLKRGIELRNPAVRGLQRLSGPRPRDRPRARAARAARRVRAPRSTRAQDDRLRGVLGRLCDLYALAEIERDRAWFQEHGRISSTRSKAVTRTVNSLCSELRPQAEPLVDAFGIPDEVLAAPIGLPGGEASRPSTATLGEELPDVRSILAELEEKNLPL